MLKSPARSAGGRHNVQVALRAADAPSFDAAEEECLVPDDRAAERSAELILAQHGRVGLAVAVTVVASEGRARVEDIVAHELIGAAVELVRSAADRNHDHAACVAAVLRRVIRRLHLHLLNRVERGDHGLRLAVLQPHHGGVVVHAVDQVVVLQGRLAVDAEAVARTTKCPAGRGRARRFQAPRRRSTRPATDSCVRSAGTPRAACARRCSRESRSPS